MTPRRITTLTSVAAALVLGLIILSGSLPVLLDRFVPDDSFYYFNTARVFAQSGFSSFDGIHYTNGFHPLWFIMSVPIFWIFPEGGEVPFRIMLVVQVILSAAATAIMLRTFARLFGIRNAAISCAAWLLVYHIVLINGLETALLMLLYATLFEIYGRIEENPSVPTFAALGVLSGLVFLARTDSLFLVGSISLALTIRRDEWQTSQRWAYFKKLLAFAAPVGILAGTYLLSNLFATGHLMPVSGAVKQYYSELARQNAIQKAGSALPVYLQNLFWSLQSPGYTFIPMGVVGPWLLSLLPATNRLAGQRVRRFWPFYLGAGGSFLFYSLVFSMPYNQYPWYYGPHAFLACFTVAGLAYASDDLYPFREIPGLSAALLAGIVMTVFGWYSWASWINTLIVAAVVLLLARWQALQNRLGLVLLIGVVILGQVVQFFFGGTNPVGALWLCATVIMLWVEVSPRLRQSSLLQSGATILLIGVLAKGTVYLLAIKAPPEGWNYNLYLGAQWARENLPAEATIWSGSAGILGYFSDRTVVNVDGLANDYDFYENVLLSGPEAGQQYLEQWDYGIDAFFSTQEAPPGGCFVPLDPELQQYVFQEGDGDQFLQVMQMKHDGVTTCPDK